MPRRHIMEQALPASIHTSHLASIYKPTETPTKTLVHLSDKLVDVVLPVTEVTALDVVLELACPPATSGVGEFERPEEV